MVKLFAMTSILLLSASTASAASVTVFYALVPGATHQLCYQKVGDANPVCKPYSANLAIDDLTDDTEYDFWIIVNGGGYNGPSPKTRIRTQKKTLVPLAAPSVVSN